ncbi:DUF1062 domain-containing protein [Micromonospora phytophila]|uniref:DUF1062 domain-containing protein n=1 Tax=Micromonospora phytophila TaxID=709888 RepID=UPI00202ECB4F|nr:DUF1062 domain-containing protein [Micromonospora phytophila]MCM0674185.1 DUF1062 domain-containing protein [Micromonospora phytophila]
MLSQTVRRTLIPQLAFRCVHCHYGLASTGDGKFRVNANGKLLDIWLLVACVSCDRTSKITIHDRVPVRYLDPILLTGYSGNPSSLVARVLLDPLIAPPNRFDSSWELLAPSPPESPWPVQVSVIFDVPVPLRPERLINQGAGHQPQGDRSPRQDRHSAEPQHSQELLVRPAMNLRRGPELEREARWPCPGLHHAAVARSLMTGRQRRSGPARYRRRR